jgi:hypothetical protein
VGEIPLYHEDEDDGQSCMWGHLVLFGPMRGFVQRWGDLTRDQWIVSSWGYFVWRKSRHLIQRDPARLESQGHW